MNDFVVKNKGVCYVVATPIGNLDDMSIRALNVLKRVHYIACEDTRKTRVLCSHFSIDTKLYSYHQHNEFSKAAFFISCLEKGEDVAIVSDAGTPTVRDPGSQLVSLCHEHNIKVVPVPGACAAIAALSASGFLDDGFVFLGFLPNQKTRKRAGLQSYVHSDKPVVLYESVHKIKSLFDVLVDIYPSERQVCIAREISKRYEQILVTTVSAISQSLDLSYKGELVIIIEGCKTINRELNDENERVLRTLLKYIKDKDEWFKCAHEITGIKKNKLYNFYQENK